MQKCSRNMSSQTSSPYYTLGRASATQAPVYVGTIEMIIWSNECIKFCPGCCSRKLIDAMWPIRIENSPIPCGINNDPRGLQFQNVTDWNAGSFLLMISFKSFREMNLQKTLDEYHMSIVCPVCGIEDVLWSLGSYNRNTSRNCE